MTGTMRGIAKKKGVEGEATATEDVAALDREPHLDVGADQEPPHGTAPETVEGGDAGAPPRAERSIRFARTGTRGNAKQNVNTGGCMNAQYADVHIEP